MRVLLSVLLVAVLTSCVLADIDCDEILSCDEDSPEACVFHSDRYCFSVFENLCTWQEYKCKHNINSKLYDMKFCELENFACRRKHGKESH